MRTTVVLDDELVAEAREVLGARTLRGLLETALREAVKARQREALIEAMGTMDLAITEEDVECMRQDRRVVREWVTGQPEAQAESPGSSGRRGKKTARAGTSR